MNRKEKITVLKEVAQGNLNNLNAIIEERKKTSISGKNIILCFYYLLEHGRTDGYSGAQQYQECCITSLDDLRKLEDGIIIAGETDDYSRISDAALNMMVECMECYHVLHEKGQLELLKPYNKQLT